MDENVAEPVVVVARGARVRVANRPSRLRRLLFRLTRPQFEKEVQSPRPLESGRPCLT